MRKTVVLNVVGLTRRFLGGAAPTLSRWARNAAIADIRPAFPAVTCTAQADYLTGEPPAVHGIVANGWYVREDCEVRFWRQSNHLVQAPRIWEAARRIDPAFTCANLFWWFNMYSTADYTITPRPMYPADGRKLPDVYTAPAGLRDDLQSRLGTFPLFNFWGPRASIASTRWIAEAAKLVEERFAPTLTLVYLPHLDYNLQRIGPSDPAAAADVREVDAVCGDLIAFYEQHGARVVVLSEYALAEVDMPVHLNRVLREHGLVAVREELGRELLDAGASAAFAVADHQVAHVYVKDPAQVNRVRTLLEGTPGVETVLDRPAQASRRIDHPRSGELVATAAARAWFTYYYWRDDRRAPDFARTVDIHRKPGYDPAELFLDPAIRVPALTVAWKLLKRKAGLRTLLDVVPLDATLVRGSHGRPPSAGDDLPILLSREKDLVTAPAVDSTDVYGLILKHLGDEHAGQHGLHERDRTVRG